MVQSSNIESNYLFSKLLKRLETLEKWRELAVRPTADDCDEDDRDMLECPVDDVKELSERCGAVRALLNAHLPILAGPHDAELTPRPSGIEGAGLGLFYHGTTPFPEGKVLCYYYGHVHNFHSTKAVSDKSYLMLVSGDVLVDPGPLPQIMARYINDPLNAAHINCKFVPDVANYRSAVVSTRRIESAEELFVAYGDAYWTQHATPGRMKV